MRSLSAGTSPPRGTDSQKDDGKPSNLGCLILTLLAVFTLDSVNVLVMGAGQSRNVVYLISVGGFACGAALGGYVSARTKRRPGLSLFYWAICGLLGMCLAAGIASQVVILRQ